MKAKSVLMGLIAGGAAAGIITLLTAPASGRETRRNLKAHKDEVMGHLKDVKDSVIELKNTVSTATKEGKSGINTFVHDLKLAIYEWKLSTDSNKAELQKDIMEIEHAIQELESELSPTAKQ
ncbi:YtxH domain-containing protein [Bacillus sp. T33-2]|uniref:YtxH domain-containing protein n=1 Tax=Bacillus sp. T33-2 TaxID=2054168 RepID=UPI000C77FFC9|nr:YtxH domain-containing protein [Bacillus sp. T33-2]PLR89959.1 hypothetical protein CVD19_23080 [Bacillus sp. T33-2]